MKAKFTLLLAFLLLCSIGNAFAAKSKVVILPFRNMDGAVKLNSICVELGDSLRNQILKEDPNQEFYEVITKEKVQAALAKITTDPSAPQYESDLWTAIQELGANEVIIANLNSTGTRFLVNAYIYDISTKLPDSENCAKNVSKKDTDYLELIPIILKKVLPGLKK